MGSSASASFGNTSPTFAGWLQNGRGDARVQNPAPASSSQSSTALAARQQSIPEPHAGTPARLGDAQQVRPMPPAPMRRGGVSMRRHVTTVALASLTTFALGVLIMGAGHLMVAAIAIGCIGFMALMTYWVVDGWIKRRQLQAAAR